MAGDDGSDRRALAGQAATRCSCNTSITPPLARKLADKAEIVEWGGESSIRKVIAELEKRGARENKVAVIGPMTFDAHAALAATFGKVTNLNRAYVKLRRVKSAEELDWFRIGAWLSRPRHGRACATRSRRA